MISLGIARQLKEAGIEWSPQVNDFFAVPDRGMDERVFVISDIMTYVEKRRGQLLITFHGALEWALDYVVLHEAIWLLSEAQVRTELEHRLVTQPRPTVTLSSTRDGYRCEIQYEGRNLAFEAFGAADAYGHALLYILQQGG
ncbi:MAG: hypothetical protein M3220_04470 [Chloroflexota bacterium]|nr:hypothetical protein [Chloroflexota bacterium]